MRFRTPLALLLRLGILAGTGAMLWLGVAHAQSANIFAAPGQGYSPAADRDYRLGPSDKIRVTVFGEEDLSGEYQIDGSGLVRLPLIGEVPAGGQTAAALEAAVQARLAGGYLNDPKVSIEVTTYRPFYIIGAVGRPGEYPYVSNMSALNAIALAGGFTPQAVESVVYVRHEGSSIEQKVPANQLTHIRPGDVVRVDTTMFWDAMSILSPLTGFAGVAAGRFIP